MITRRSFLAGALTAGGIALVGGELLLPKRKTYFLPPAGGWLPWRLDAERHVHYQNFMQAVVERYANPAFVSVQHEEWCGPDLVGMKAGRVYYADMASGHIADRLRGLPDIEMYLGKS